MSAPMFVVDPAAASSARVGDEVTLAGPEGRHAVAVSRVAAGERIDLVDGLGTVLRTEVVAVEGREVLRARVLDRWDEPAPQPRLVVVQAVPKGDRAEVAVETLTEVGVDVIVPWQADRCVARWAGDKVQRGPARWAAVARAAGKQSRRARFPEVAALARTTEVCALVARASAAVILHEGAADPLAAMDWPSAGDVVLVVGPEGGITPDERDQFAGAGARVARLGPSVLRTSTAGTVAAAVVLSRTTRWA